MAIVKFVCPQCGNTCLGECYKGALVVAPVMGFEFYADSVTDHIICAKGPRFLGYNNSNMAICTGDPEAVEHEDGSLHMYFACKDCGYVIRDKAGKEIQSNLELFEWLKERDMIEPGEV